MEKSTVYHVMTRPKLIVGLPLDYMVFSFVISGFAGLGGLIWADNALGIIGAMLPFILFFWVIGFFMTKQDPEFFGVWIKGCFHIGDVVSLDGKRDYEP